ncbi:helix-turn-helix domain-containing protein [Nitrososphaera sp.]|uniref:AlbA family DNA-binding domain-containing protein n=1 Tax=Nitrososphaera sp. TaxID=1971748 RepID=UPI00181F514D|nr:ATP-binding protein [Nitrososphaera sp.]NWG37825.1 ATP-binding protein [Nitrososphaera sp.]
MSATVDLNTFIPQMTARIGHSHIMIRLALDNRNGNPNTFCFGKIDFIPQSMTLDDVTYDYGNFRLIRRTVPIDQLTNIIGQIQSGALTIDGTPINLDRTGGRDSHRFIPSESNWGVIDADGPQHVIFTGAGGNRQVPYDSLESRPGTPHYTTKIQAVVDFMGLRQIAQSTSELILSVHELRGKIAKLEIVGKNLTVEVNGTATDESLYVQFYCRKGEKKSDATLDIPVSSRKATYSVPFEPDLVNAILVRKGTNEILDEKHLGGWIPGQGGIIVRTPESDLRDMIASGESRTVEFKTGTGEDLFRTVVSFSNTDGGTIIVGVTDDKKVIGFEADEERTRKSVESRANTQCYPAIEPKLEWTELDGRPLLIIKVPEGTNKPYTLRGSGGFIRNGDGDYPIERPDLDKIYEGKSQGNRGFTGN